MFEYYDYDYVSTVLFHCCYCCAAHKAAGSDSVTFW